MLISFPEKQPTQHNIWFSKIVIIQLKYILDSFVFQIFKTTHLFVVGCHTKKIFLHWNSIIFVSVIYFLRWTVQQYDVKNRKSNIWGVLFVALIKMGQGVQCSRLDDPPNLICFFEKKQSFFRNNSKKTKNENFVFTFFFTKASSPYFVVLNYNT